MHPLLNDAVGLTARHFLVYGLNRHNSFVRIHKELNIPWLAKLTEQRFVNVQYSHLVDVVLEGALTDEKQIEHILDGILDFGDDLRFLDLSKILCRHIYYQYPQLVGNFVHMYRAMFEEKEDDNGTGDS